MAGTITLGGLASGLDTSGIIAKLVEVNSAHLYAMQARASQLRSAATTLSDIGRSLSDLKTAAGALSSWQEASPDKASSSGQMVAPSVTGDAQPGTYNVSVTQLAQAQRTYSKTFTSYNTALGMSGTFTISIGGGSAVTITVVSTDTLQGISDKINAAGIRVTSAVFYDGSKYRLQVQGMDTGAANYLTFAGGLASQGNLDLNGAGQNADRGKTVQVAQDAKITIDTFNTTSAKNEVTGLIPGVTLSLKGITASPETITVAGDPDALVTKVKSVVDAYNKVVDQAHAAAGFGEQKASNPVLRGDSAVRMTTDRLRQTIVKTYQTGKYDSLAMIGVSVDKTGKLSLDESKLKAAYAADPAGVQKLLGRGPGATTGGAMATLEDLANELTKSSTGTITMRQDAFNTQAKRLDDDVAKEQTRLDKYAEQLQKSFSAMETSYGASQALLNQLGKMYG